MEDKISIDDFKKVQIKIGKILSAERVPETDKLLKLSVDLGEAEPRQIISGIAEYFPDPNALVGKLCPFVANLLPRTLRGLESNGMIMAISGEDNLFSLMEPSVAVPPGSGVR